MKVDTVFDGYQVILSDTAGLRETDEEIESSSDEYRMQLEIEREGMKRAIASTRKADLVLLVIDASRDTRESVRNVETTKIMWDALSQRIESTEMNGPPHTNSVIFLFNKADKVPLSCREQKVQQVLSFLDAMNGSPLAVKSECLWVSSVTGEGLNELRGLMALKCASLCKLAMERAGGAIAYEAHQREHLKDSVSRLETLTCDESMDSSHSLLVNNLEIVAEELHLAAKALGKLTGEGVDSEAMLGSLFSRFCIGK